MQPQTFVSMSLAMVDRLFEKPVVCLCVPPQSEPTFHQSYSFGGEASSAEVVGPAASEESQREKVLFLGQVFQSLVLLFQ